MSDLISRRMAIDAVLSIGHIAKLTDGDAVIRMSAVNYVLRTLPSAEPEIIRYGKWIEREEDMDGMTLQIKRCSECGASKPMKIFRLENYEFNFCPNCGADMRGEEEC